MNPEEKAKELISKLVSISLSQYVDLVDGIRISLAKKSALIAVDEIISNRERIKGIDKLYWQQVKHEIEQL